MSLIKWSPIRDLLSIQDEMNKLFDERLDRFSGGELQSRVWQPLVDIYEEEDKFVIKAEIPEVKKEDISINLENNVLTIKGERKMEKEEKKENYHRAERFYGMFQRSFTLPGIVDQDKIKANLENGVLTLEIPKKEEVKPKKIEINIK
jgi:HSP20 family protein